MSNYDEDRLFVLEMYGQYLTANHLVRDLGDTLPNIPWGKEYWSLLGSYHAFLRAKASYRHYRYTDPGKWFTCLLGLSTTAKVLSEECVRLKLCER